MIAGSNHSPSPLMDLVLRLKQCCEAQEQVILARADLSSSELACLRAMPEDAWVAAGALASRMRLSPSRGSRVAEHLVQRGLLVRTPSETDRRVTMLGLSARGKEVRGEIERCLAACEAHVRTRLDEDERALVDQGLVLAIRALQEEP